MKLLEKTDEEILEIANPLWDDLVKYSTIRIMGALQSIFQNKCCLVQMK
jgi:hypothetical protein